MILISVPKMYFKNYHFVSSIYVFAVLLDKDYSETDNQDVSVIELIF